MKKINLWLVIGTLLLSIGCSKSSINSVNSGNGNNGNGGTNTPKSYDAKKGFDVVTKSTNGWATRVKALHVSWHYSWGSTLMSDEPDSVDFVPMIWGFWGNYTKLDSTINSINSEANSNKVHYLLGFNEPDKKDQSNMTVQTALAAWPHLMNAKVPLGSPACANDTDQWMQDFMAQADTLNYRVDFVAVHWYGGDNAVGFINYLKNIYNLYKKPIWITEFAVADWNATSISTNKYSKAQILSFMQQVLPALDQLSFVKRYAWFSASTSDAHLGNSALFNPDGSLTTLGQFYSQF